ncbi:ATP-dependent DNA helicase [uncultured archaeon]|nr:ATP-dependent DNA helicase [uncultured archaeon]
MFLKLSAALTTHAYKSILRRKAMPDNSFPLFPFSKIRDGQRQLMDAVQRTVENRKCLLANAPTGIGKTAGVLAPALQYALQNNLTIIFLTPRHSQHKIVIDTLREIQKKSEAKIRVSDIIGKRWLCNLQAAEDMQQGDFEAHCTAMKKDNACEYSNNTWQKTGGMTPDARKILARLQDEILHVEEAKRLCKNLCPADIISESSRDANVIIADYFHIFHPAVREVFLRKSGKTPEECILVIDEAHNVPSRARGLLSAQLSGFQLERAVSEADEFGNKMLAEDLEYVSGFLSKLAKEKFENARNISEIFIKKGEVADVLEKVGGREAFLDSLQEAAEKVREKRKKSFLGGVASFFSGWNGPDMGFARILRKSLERKGEFNITYDCLDPSIATKEILEACHSVILMSGTLQPIEMYEELFGLAPARTEKLVLTSPFPPENRLCLVLKDVTTKFTKRDDEGLLKISGNLVKIINRARGNIGVFFPSYFLRDSVFGLIERSIVKPALLERPNMSKDEKQELYKKFVKAAGNFKGAALLGVIGGNFNEGVDFPGKIMNTVVIVGLPLEKPDLLTEALISYYDFKFNRGWDYGYSYPAITKAVQTAGRVIRSETDRGIIVFMDERYLWQNYKKVLPPDMNLKTTKDVGADIDEFFLRKH